MRSSGVAAKTLRTPEKPNTARTSWSMPTLLTPNFSRLARYGFAIVVVVIAALLREILSPLLGQGVPFILFSPAVAVAAWLGGFWPGILYTALSGFLSWYVFMPPYLSWTVFNTSAAGLITIFL